MTKDEHVDLTQPARPKSKKYRAAIFLLVIAGFCCMTAFICQAIYAEQKQTILAVQKDQLQVSATGTTDSMALWASDLETQARRVSEAELYRLFATEVSQLDASRAGLLNDPDAAAMLTGEGSQLVEQVPLMRNVLLDFINYNGMQDARVVRTDGVTLLSSLSRPAPLLESQRLAIRNCVETGRVAFGMVRGTAAGLVLDYAAPLMPVQAEGKAKAVAALLLSVPATGHVAQFLARAAGPDQVFSPWLLQKNEGQWESIRVQTAQPVVLDAKIPVPDAAGALPFDARLSIGGDKQVYSLGIKVPELNWTLVQQVPAERVQAQLRNAFSVIYGIGALLCAGLLLLLSLTWWIMVGREQRSVAQRFEKLYNVIRQQKQLLDSVNVSLDVGLFLADTNGVIQVANRAFAHIVEKDESLLTGQALGALFGGQVAGQLQDAIRAVAAGGSPDTLEITLPMPGGDRLFRVTLFPFMDQDAGEGISGAVVTLQDITEFRRQSEARRKQQMQTIEALVGAIEKVDPYLTGRSRMMRRLAQLMAEHMDLDAKDRNTLSTAASLSQMGKIFVPRDLLTKTEKLTPEEQNELMRVPEYAYNVLRNIDFGLPVPGALLQMYEKLDGTGYPNHLKGEDIAIHARILGVLNSFCAMVSPRAFRDGLPVDSALDNLQGPGYDPAVVEALARVVRTPEGAQAVNDRQA